MRSPNYFKSLWEFNFLVEKKKSESHSEAKNETISFARTGLVVKWKPGP